MPELPPGNMTTTPGDRLRTPMVLGRGRQHFAMPRSVSMGDLGYTASSGSITFGSTATIAIEGYPDSDSGAELPRQILSTTMSGISHGKSSSIGYAPGDPLPRLLPDKLKWTHDTQERLWHLADDREIQRLTVQQIATLRDRFGASFKSGRRRSLQGSIGGAGGATTASSLTYSQSQSTIRSMTTSRASSAYDPPLMCNSRSVNELHRKPRGGYRYNPPSPSSLAVSKLPNPPLIRGAGLALGHSSPPYPTKLGLM